MSAVSGHTEKISTAQVVDWIHTYNPQVEHLPVDQYNRVVAIVLEQLEQDCNPCLDKLTVRGVTDVAATMFVFGEERANQVDVFGNSQVFGRDAIARHSIAFSPRKGSFSEVERAKEADKPPTIYERVCKVFSRFFFSNSSPKNCLPKPAAKKPFVEPPTTARSSDYRD